MINEGCRRREPTRIILYTVLYYYCNNKCKTPFRRNNTDRLARDHDDYDGYDYDEAQIKFGLKFEKKIII